MPSGFEFHARQQLHHAGSGRGFVIPERLELPAQIGSGGISVRSHRTRDRF